MTGHTFQRGAIEAWYAHKSASGEARTSPLTGKEVSDRLTPNFALREAIEKLCPNSEDVDDDEEDEEDED